MNKWLKVSLIVILISLTLFTRFWQLDNPDPSKDELSYINDGYGYLIGDPSISPRHHMFHHPPPNFPHPFLVPLTIALSFKIFGYSLFTGRLPIAMFSALTVGAVFITTFFTLGGFKKAIVASVLSASLPLNIRYARESYLDGGLTLFVVLTTLFWWLFCKKQKSIYAILTGFCIALAISTKITGLVLILPVLVTGYILLRKKSKNYIALLLLIFTAILVFFLFNSPPAYLDGLLHHPNTRTDNWGILSILKGFLWPQYYPYWIYMIIFNFTPSVILLLIYAVYRIAKERYKPKSANINFLFIFFALYVIISIVTHLPNNISGPWAFQPELNLALIICTYGLFQLKPKWQKIVFLMTILSILPMSFIHGLRIIADPEIPYHNVVLNEVNIAKVRQDLIFLSSGRDYFIATNLNQSEFPEWLYPKNINYTAWKNTRPKDAIITDQMNDPVRTNPDYTLFKTYTYQKLATMYLYIRK